MLWHDCTAANQVFAKEKKWWSIDVSIQTCKSWTELDTRLDAIGLSTMGTVYQVDDVLGICIRVQSAGATLHVTNSAS
jgi:hypothetical protein